MSCRYDRTVDRRVLVGRHHDACDRADCPGCQPCTARHCVVCTCGHCDNVHPQTCPQCTGLIRENLAAIVDLEERRQLSLHLGHAYGDGRLNAGPVGGDAMVMGADGRYLSAGRRGPDELASDPPLTLLVLATWEDDWRIELGHGGGPRATVWRCVDYLSTHLTMMAQRHLAFDEFAADVAAVRGRLEAVLGEGDRPEQADATCIKCGGTLIRPATDRGISDYWHCTGHCRRVLTTDDYNLALRQFTEAHLATAQALGARLSVAPATIRQWATRGYVKRWGQDREGRTLYQVAEVERHSQRQEEGRSA